MTATPISAPELNPKPVQSKLAAVLRVTSGNFLEMFDFFLFGFYADLHRERVLSCRQ